MREIKNFYNDRSVQTLVDLALEVSKNSPSDQIIEGFIEKLGYGADIYMRSLVGIFKAKGLGDFLNDKHNQIFEHSCNINKINQSVFELFSRRGLSFFELKGCSLSSRLYDSLFARMSADVDILISVRDLDRVHSLLLDDGFSQELLFINNGLRQVRPPKPIRKASRRLLANYRKEHSNVEIQLGAQLYARCGLTFESLSKAWDSSEDYESTEIITSVLIFICDKHKDLLNGSGFFIRCLVDILTCLRILEERSLIDDFFNVAKLLGLSIEVIDVLSIFVPISSASLSTAIAKLDNSPSVFFKNLGPELFTISSPVIRNTICNYLQAKAVCSHANSLRKEDLNLYAEGNKHRLHLINRGNFLVVKFIYSVPNEQPFFEFIIEGYCISNNTASHWHLRIIVSQIQATWTAKLYSLKGQILLEVKEVDATNGISFKIISVDPSINMIVTKRIEVFTADYFDKSFNDFTRKRLEESFPLL